MQTLTLFFPKFNFCTFFCTCGTNISRTNWAIAIKFSAFVNCPIRNRVTHFLIDFLCKSKYQKKCNSQFWRLGLGRTFFLLDNGSSCLPMATLPNCQVFKLFHIPKLCYLCHKFKLFKQKNVGFRCHGNKKNIFL